MPLYEYECKKDGRFELIRKFSDPPLKACPTCGQPIEKLLSSPAIQFKGTGWYITDYARKGNGSSSESGGDKEKGKGESSAKAEASSKDSGAKDSGSKDGGSKDSGSKSESSASPKKSTSSGSSAS